MSYKLSLLQYETDEHKNMAVPTFSLILIPPLSYKIKLKKAVTIINYSKFTLSMLTLILLILIQ